MSIGASAMKVELPGESKPFADIEEGECFAFTRKQVTSVCMKVEWLSSASVPPRRRRECVASSKKWRLTTAASWRTFLKLG
jgi:hypothetical protein